jgi:hypothetical protein
LGSNLYPKYGYARQRGNYRPQSVGSNVSILRRRKALVFGERAGSSSSAKHAIFDGTDRSVALVFRLCSFFALDCTHAP